MRSFVLVTSVKHSRCDCPVDSPDVVRLLLLCGADPTIKGALIKERPRPKTPEELAISENSISANSTCATVAGNLMHFDCADQCFVLQCTAHSAVQRNVHHVASLSGDSARQSLPELQPVVR